MNLPSIRHHGAALAPVRAARPHTAGTMSVLLPLRSAAAASAATTHPTPPARRRLLDAKVTGMDENLNGGMSRFFNRTKRAKTPTPAT